MRRLFSAVITGLGWLTLAAAMVFIGLLALMLIPVLSLFWPYLEESGQPIRTFLAFVLIVFSLLLLGIAMIYVGRSMERIERPAGRCPHCGYDLRGGTTACPECGTAV